MIQERRADTSQSTNEKILLQAMEIFEGRTPLTRYEAIILSLQILGWAKISQSDELPPDLRIEERRYPEPDRVADVWRQLAGRTRTLSAAYSNWNTAARVTPSLIGSAVDLCIRLAETGMLNNFDPTDCLAQIGGKDIGESFLPSELADLMTSLAQVQPGTTVYSPWDNSIQLAVRAARLGAAVYVETMGKRQLPALLSMFADGRIEIGHGDPIRDPSAVEGGRLRQFDSCVAFPPLGSRYPTEIVDRDLYGRFRERTKSGTVLALWHIIAQTTGRAVLAVPHSLLFSPGSDRNVRDELLRRGALEAVIDMPSGLLLYTNVSFVLLVLNMGRSSETVRFINAELDRFRQPISRARAKLADIDGIIERATGALKDELVAEVSREFVNSNDNTLQVGRYVLLDTARKTTQLLASSPTRPLDELVSTLRPIQPKPAGGGVMAWEVGAADLPEFAYIAKPTKQVNLDLTTVQKNREQFLQPLDIVLIIKGSVGKLGIVPNNVPPAGDGGWIVGQSGIVLRVRSKDAVDPKALFMYLRSPIGQQLLEGIAVKGATIPLIQQRELQRLPVAVPMKGEAKKIGRILDEQAELQQQIDELRERQAGLSRQVWSLDL